MPKVHKHVAYHEAGHAVARVYVGAQPTAVETRADGGGTSYGTSQQWESSRKGQYAAWDLVLYSLAGPRAEARISRTAYVVIVLTSGREDYESAKPVIRWLIQHGFADGEKAAWHRAEEEVRQFMRTHWPHICRVADALMSRGRLEGPEVVQIVGQRLPVCPH